jgi:IclR family transcriptional regulator, acetate operon repressor
MRPVRIALQLIEALAEKQPAGVTELAAIIGVPRSTAQRALVTLGQYGWIEFADESQGTWRLTMRALITAGRATQAHGTLRNIAIPVMEELRRATKETVHLMVRSDDSVVLVERLDGILPVDQFRPFGSDAPLTLTATGKSILAALPSNELDAILKKPIPKRSELSVTDPVELRKELRRVREQGYALARGGNRATVGAVGAAILDAMNHPFAAISVSGPLGRMTSVRCRKYGPLVADSARRISMGVMWQAGFTPKKTG